MDIGMWIKDYNKQLIDEFQNNGLYLEHLFGRVKVKRCLFCAVGFFIGINSKVWICLYFVQVEDSFQMSFKTVDDIKLDIFFFYEEGAYMWNGGTQAKTGKKFKWVKSRFHCRIILVNRR